MKSLNQVSLIGHLASDPESRQTPTGKLVVYFPLATNEKWTSKTGEKKESVDFHRIVAWEKLAETMQKYLKKGSAVFIGGRLRNRSYEDKTGVKRFTTEIIASDLNILTFKSKETETANSN